MGHRRRCPLCSTKISPDALYCYVHVLFLARQATRAYDDVKRLEPSATPDGLILMSIAYIECGHERHHRAKPELGCPFCRVRA